MNSTPQIASGNITFVHEDKIIVRIETPYSIADMHRNNTDVFLNASKFSDSLLACEVRGGFTITERSVANANNPKSPAVLRDESIGPLNPAEIAIMLLMLLMAGYFHQSGFQNKYFQCECDGTTVTFSIILEGQQKGFLIE